MDTPDWSEIVAVEVRDRSGASARFENLVEALACLGYRRFVAILLDLERPPSPLLDVGRVAIRDEMGLDIPVWWIREELGDRLTPSLGYSFWRSNAPMPAFRSGPVPFTGRRGGYAWNRPVRTTQERRYLAGVKVDGDGARERAARRSIPSDYDDVTRHCERSWKRHRRTQWRGG
ncbi:conserved hypothetical protein [Hyphomicrobiales bacterium]|nr:conserved hypothetical protein [Hyphomicrobiales bacterium]CAH1702807.1 conserved hypothetical protein [Hyphomicrobiales bacterium]CAI0346996.1 conserved hypothetical protein [Hyphomicrobiales bacterium]